MRQRLVPSSMPVCATYFNRRKSNIAWLRCTADHYQRLLHALHRLEPDRWPSASVDQQFVVAGNPCQWFVLPGLYVFQLTAGSVSSTVTNTVCNFEESPLDIALIFDTSSSMDPVMPQLRIAGRTFLDMINLGTHQVSMITFDGVPLMWQPLTHTRSLITPAVEAMKFSVDSTVVAPAIRLAAAELLGPHRNPASSPVIILLSDGDWESQSLVNEAADEAKMAGIRIISVGYNTGTFSDTLKEVASSEGDCSFTDDAAPCVKSMQPSRNRFALIEIEGQLFCRILPEADMTQPVQLFASVYDENPTTLTKHWEKVSGPGTVTFTPADNVLSPKAVFGTPGTYELRLTASEPVRSLRFVRKRERHSREWPRFAPGCATGLLRD